MAIRRWRVWSIVLAAAILPAALAHGAGLPAGFTPADFETVDAKELPTKVGSILQTLPPRTDVLARDKAANEVIAQFTAADVGINSKRPEARLNAAILIANLGNLNSDHALQLMLKNGDVAVRYYGAKGLGQKPLPDLEKSAAAATGGMPIMLINNLATAAKKETSPVVQQEIIKTLIIYEAADALVDAAEAITNQMQMSAPDVGTLQIDAQALNVITSKAGALEAANKSKIAVVAVNGASYAIQQYRVAEKAAKEEGKEMPKELTAATLKLVDAAAKLAGKKIDGSSIDAAEFDMDEVFGKPGGAGKVTGIPAPGVIKTGG